MVVELHDSHTGLYIPQHASHIPRTSDDLTIVDESTTAEITGVSAEFPSALAAIHGIFSAEVIDGAYVVEATTCYKVTRRRIGTNHDPTRSQRYGVDFVRSVGVPYDQFAVL